MTEAELNINSKDSLSVPIQPITKNNTNNKDTGTRKIPSSPSSTTDTQPPAKRKRNSSTYETPVKIAVAPPQQPVALPPPLIPYHHTHLIPSYYPIYQHPYFLTIGSQPPVSPSLSPTQNFSNMKSNQPNTTTNNQNILPKSTTTEDNPIFPNTTANNDTTDNNTTTAPKTAIVAPLPPHSPSGLQPSYNFYPYAFQISPQLHPTASVPAPIPPNNLSPVAYHSINMAPAKHASVPNSTAVHSTADQREQARKVSHSAIERRRREKINDKIMQLKDLIPACSDRENLHKMTILQSAIDYITYLKKVVEKTEDGKKEKSTKETHIDTPPELQIVSSTSVVDHQPSDGTNSTEGTNEKSPVSRPDEEDEEDEEEDEDWHMHSPSHSEKNDNLPNSSLKPMDIIQLNKTKQKLDSSPPKIVIVEGSASHQHNMNIENILC